VTENKKLMGLKQAYENGLESQVVMRLITNSIARQPNYWLRTMDCDVTRDVVREFNRQIVTLLKTVLKWNDNSEGELPAHVITRAQLPTKVGGLSLLVPDLAPEVGYIAGAISAATTIEDIAGELQNPLRRFRKKPPPWLEQAQDTLKQALGELDADYEGYWKMPKPQYSIQQTLHKATRRELVASLHTTQRAVLTTAAAPGAAAWLYAAPWKGYTLTNPEYMRALRLRLS
jgi:hypothetical protein